LSPSQDAAVNWHNWQTSCNPCGRYLKLEILEIWKLKNFRKKTKPKQSNNFNVFEKVEEIFQKLFEKMFQKMFQKKFSKKCQYLQAEKSKKLGHAKFFY